MEKRGQFKLSFGMIFSIILIVFFLAFAIYVTINFLDIGKTASVGEFLNTFQNDIDKIWKGSQASQEKEYSLPKEIKKVCFVDFSSGEAGSKGPKKNLYSELEFSYHNSENMVFSPFGSAGIDSKEIKNIDIEKITEKENPYCIDNINGKLKLTIKKDFGEALVRIERN